MFLAEEERKKAYVTTKWLREKPDFGTNIRMTSKERKFVEGVTSGLSCSQSSRQAGYANPREGWRILRRADVREAVLNGREAWFAGDLSTLATRTVEWCMRNGRPDVRLKAAVYALQIAGVVDKTKYATQENSRKTLIEMSEQELLQFVRGKERELLVLEAGAVKNVAPQNELEELLS